MKATWDRLEKNVVEYRVEVEAERVARAEEAAFRRLNSKANIPGFRRGKAPRALYERYYGKGSVLEEAVRAMVPEAYADAVTDSQLDPIAEPEFNLERAESGEPLVFKAKVEVKPEVTLGRIKGFEGLTPEVAEVTDEQVNQQLDQLRDRMATLVPVEDGETQHGSFAVIDFEGFVDGVPFEGGKAEDYTIEVGSGTFIPGFEEGLVGLKPGEEKDITVTFPEQYQAANLAGKEAVFKVKVKELKRKELPELDDAFAAQVSRFQTLQELKQDLTNRLKESAEREAERNFQNKVVEAVASEAQVELPETLVHRTIHTLMNEMEQSMAQQGMSMEQYLQATGKDSDALHDDLRESAEKRVKISLVLDAVAKSEGVTVTDAQVDAEFDRMASMYTKDVTRIRQLQVDPEFRGRVYNDLLSQNTIEHLTSLNK